MLAFVSTVLFSLIIFTVCLQKEEDGYVLSDEEQQILEQTNMDQLVQQSTDYTHMLHALGPLLKVSTLWLQHLTKRLKPTA